MEFIDAFEGKYFFSDLFNKESSETLACIMQWFSIFNCILSVVGGVVIATQTPDTMRSFKHLLLMVIASSTMFDTFCTFYKPAVLLPLPIFIPVDPIGSITYALENVGPFVIFINMALICDLILCLFIQRYFTMTNLIVAHPRYLEPAVYATVFSTNFVLCAFIILGNWIWGDRLNESQTLAFLQTYIVDWEKVIASGHYPYINVVFSSTKTISVFARYYSMFFGISRFLAFIFFTHKNMMVVKNSIVTTADSKKHHQMIIKLLKCELFAVILFLVLPANVSIWLIATRAKSPLLFMYCNLLFKFYPPIDSFLTMILIKPYRKFVKKLICKLCRIKYNKINDSSSNNLRSNYHVDEAKTNVVANKF